MIEAAFHIFVVLVACAMAGAFFRLLRGPTVADRINAADVIAICGIGLALGNGWRHGEGLWLDVAVVAALVLFVGTTSVALFLDPEALGGNDR